MPGEFSDRGSRLALDTIVGKAYAGQTNMYLALLTAAPADNQALGGGTISGITEYAATGYARQAIASATGWNAVALNGSSIPEISNANVITFGPFTASTGATITHAALVSVVSGTAGDLVAWWQLDTSRTPAVNDSVSVAASALKLSVE